MRFSKDSFRRRSFRRERRSTFAFSRDHREEERTMTDRQPTGVISIGSNDIHLLVAASDGIGTFDRHANQSMLAELVGAVKGGVIPANALGQALQDLEALVKV